MSRLAARLRLAALTCLAALIALPVPTRGGLLDDLGINSDESRQSEKYTCQPLAPPKNPAQHSGGEGVPPLPLPAVPLRRTEKKNPPRPPVLIAKLATGSTEDWATNPNDADNLLRWMTKELKVNFSTINLPADQVPADPREVPVLYRTGHNAFTFSPEQRAKLRAYLLAGGTLIFDACCGRREFATSAMKEMELLIPERPPYRLGMDHPLYHSYYDIKQIRYRSGALRTGVKNDDSSVIGIDVGCRTAVFFFRYDVSCGWDDQADNDRHHCLGYDVDTSKSIGANLMAYITAERNAAMPLSKALNYVDEGDAKAGKFIIAQAKYSGIWRTRDAGLSMLLNAFHAKTSTPVRFERRDIALDSPQLFDVPFIYLTGHDDFQLTAAERDNLRRYVARGGLILAEACCGRAGFDQAFRRELRQILPDDKLAALPSDHLIYKYPNTLDGVTPRPAMARQLGAQGKVPPLLYGVTVNGNLAVIYSPAGLACGWELAQCPYCFGIEGNDAINLGVNILSYAITQ